MLCACVCGPAGVNCLVSVFPRFQRQRPSTVIGADMNAMKKQSIALGGLILIGMATQFGVGPAGLLAQRPNLPPPKPAVPPKPPAKAPAPSAAKGANTGAASRSGSTPTPSTAAGQGTAGQSKQGSGSSPSGGGGPAAGGRTGGGQQAVSGGWPARRQPAVGMTVNELTASWGQPKQTIYVYDGRKVTLTNGRITSMDPQ
jgi:hypothetical protein